MIEPLNASAPRVRPDCAVRRISYRVCKNPLFAVPTVPAMHSEASVNTQTKNKQDGHERSRSARVRSGPVQVTTEHVPDGYVGSRP